MSTKKILQLHSSGGFFGAERVIAELSLVLRATRYQPVLGVFNNSSDSHLELVDFARQNGIENKIFDCRNAFDLRTIFELRDFIKQNDIDIVQTHGYKSNFYALFSTLFLKVPVLATCHPWIKTSRRGRNYARVDAIFLKKFKRIIAISLDVRTELIQSGISKQKIAIIDNGINVDKFDDVHDLDEMWRKFAIPSGRKIVGTVGRLDFEKGHRIMVLAAQRVLKHVPNAFFILAGDGSLRDDLKNLAKELGIQDHLLFPGIVDDIPRVMALFDVFVLPSLTEGLPMALLEAMAAKKPIITSKVGSIPQVLENGGCGILVKPGDPDLLAGEIVNLLLNSEKAQKLSAAAYQRVKNCYSSRKMAAEYMEVYDQLLNEAKSARHSVESKKDESAKSHKRLRKKAFHDSKTKKNILANS
jgi:glycosyltransferase involved in cell wall biosynthesis